VNDLVIRRARIAGTRLVDVLIAGGRIARLASAMATPRGVDELDGGGGWLIPGLHDHHLHLRSMVAHRSSVRAGPPDVRDADQLAVSLRTARGSPDDGAERSGWIRAVGYHESVAGDLDRDVLDTWVTDRPVRVQHRSGILWILNSRALELVGADADPAGGIEREPTGRPTGRLWRMDDWLRRRTHSPHFAQGVAGDAGAGGLAGADGLASLSREAATLGVTGWTDATPGRSDQETSVLAGAVSAGIVRQRLTLMLRSGGSAVPIVEGGCDLVTAGPVKVLLDDFDLPALDSLVGLIREAHETGRPVAVHCVTRSQIVLTLAALESAGAAGALGSADRIEHGSVIPADVIPDLRRLRVTVVTQPNFVSERGDDYFRSVEADDLVGLWRARSLVDAGVAVAAGTDAPFGVANPWAAIRAAVERVTPSGACLGPDERVDIHTAVRWWYGSGADPSKPRRIQPGEPADLVVLGAPLEEVVVEPGHPPVAATVVAGKVVFS
jgi:predicted amidohydrolase YtcJ